MSWINVLIFITYFVIFGGSVSVLLRGVLKIPYEIVRKYQHIMYASSVIFYITLFDTAFEAFYAAAMFLFIGFFVLFAFEKSKYYKKMIIDRNKRGGEVKYSILYGQIMFILLILIFWAWLDFKEVIIVAVATWGIGDALAAVIGKKFGKNKIHLEGVDPKKSFEGSSALIIGVSNVVFFLMIFYIGYPVWVSLIIALISGFTSSIVEAFTHGGLDTITMPLSAAIIIYFLMIVFSLLGVI